MKTRIGLIFCFLLGLTAFAEEAATVNFQIETKVNTFTGLNVDPSLYQIGAAQNLFGSTIVEAVITLRPDWPDEGARLRIDDDDIFLKLENGIKVPILGDLRFTDVYDWSVSGISLSANSRGSEAKTVRYLFRVPVGTRQATLNVGSAEEVLSLNSPKTFLEPGKRMRLKIQASDFLESLPEYYGREGLYIHSTLKNPNGVFLRVQLEIETFDMANGHGGLNWSDRNFGLILKGGAYVPCLGHTWDVSGRRTGDWEVNNGTKNIGSRDRKYDEVLYFPVPRDTQSFQICYAGKPLADGVVGGTVSIDDKRNVRDMTDQELAELDAFKNFLKPYGVIAYKYEKGSSPRVVIEWELGSRPLDKDKRKAVYDAANDFAKSNCKALRITNLNTLR